MLGRSLKGYGRQGQPQGTLTRIQSSLGSVLFLVRVRVRVRVRLRLRLRLRVRMLSTSRSRSETASGFDS